MNTILVPYLNFDGNARSAMEFYQSVLGGELVIQSFADAFPDTPDEIKERTMHAQLKAGEMTLMASDTHPDHSPVFAPGNNVSLSLIGKDAALLTEQFTKLAEGGKIEMPLEKQFWGDVFGALEDKFGIHWMVNITTQ